MSQEISPFIPSPEEGRDGVPIRSYAEANRELVLSFVRYLESHPRGYAPMTIRSYRESCTAFVETLGSTSVIEINRADIRTYLTDLIARGLTDNTARLRTNALRLFWKFLGLSSVSKYNPTFALSQRRLPGRLPRVLTISEVEKLIAAAENPFERATVETLYSTGIRVSEFVHLRLDDVDFAEHIILVRKGKGGKDRYVLFGRPAAKAISDYLAWRPSKTFLFEASPRQGYIRLSPPRKYDVGGGNWRGTLYVDSRQRTFHIGNLRNLPTEVDAWREFNRIAANLPGFHPVPARAYCTHAIRNVVNRLAHRAGVGHVHPHSLRRAFACHMLSSGANIRAIQELLGHDQIQTTQIYTHLTAQELKRIHENCHPHEQSGGSDDKNK